MSRQAILFLCLIFSTVLVPSLFPVPTRAQGAIEILEQRADYLFDSWMHFSVRFNSTEVIQEGFVLYQLPRREQPSVYQGELAADQSMDVEIPLTNENKPSPFTELVYWYRFSTDHGVIYESEPYSLVYEDNRYNWQTVERAPFTLRWHNGDAQFAAGILAAAELGSRRAGDMLPLSELSPLTIWVYDNPQDVQLIADQAGFTWQAGHTDLAAGRLLLSLPPGDQQSLEVQRQVPHEIAHLMLYQTLGAERYARLPVWLIEGLASNAEIYSDPVRAELVTLAASGDSLLPFFSLCAAFPQDAASARLAYAQAASLVDYLFTHYGKAGLGVLVDAYAATGDCMKASLPSFGKDLTGIESEWRASLAAASDPLARLSGIPWAAIAGSAVIALVLLLAIRFLTRSERRKHG